MQNKHVGLLLVFISVLLVDIGQLFLKYGLSSLGALDFGSTPVSTFLLVFRQPFVLIGVVLFISSSFGWLLALSKVPLSLAYPIVSIGYVLVSLFSWLLFNENFSGLRFLGLGVIVVGVFFLSRT